MQHIDGLRSLAATMDASCLGIRVGRLHRRVAREFEHALRPVGLTLPQLEILVALVVAGGAAKPGLLAERLGLERSTVSRNLALLQAREWAAPATVSPSGRAMAVVITEAGMDALAAAEQAWAATQRAVSDWLGPDAAAVLDGWLDTPPAPAD